jgi:hypothetical protein
LDNPVDGVATGVGEGDGAGVGEPAGDGLEIAADGETAELGVPDDCPTGPDGLPHAASTVTTTVVAISFTTRMTSMIEGGSSHARWSARSATGFESVEAKRINSAGDQTGFSRGGGSRMRVCPGTSQSDDGRSFAMAFFEDREGILARNQQVEHAASQQRGREEFFLDYWGS